MKRTGSRSRSQRNAGLDQLVEVLLSMKTPTQMRALLDDLCTPAELEALSDRWQTVTLLLKDIPYREISEETGVSVTTISRVARSLNRGAGGYLLAAKALGLRRHRSSDKDSSAA